MQEEFRFQISHQHADLIRVPDEEPLFARRSVDGHEKSVTRIYNMAAI